MRTCKLVAKHIRGQEISVKCVNMSCISINRLSRE